MKFSKKLLQAESLLPDLKQLCFRYKELKKLLGQIKTPHTGMHGRLGARTPWRTHSSKMLNALGAQLTRVHT